MVCAAAGDAGSRNPIQSDALDSERDICVEASGPAGPLAIFFFRRHDGAWCVFPPESECSAISASFECSAIEVSAG